MKKSASKSPGSSRPARSTKSALARTARAKSGGSRPDSDVDAYLRDLDHPLKKEIESLRRIILGASPKIGEAVKWNAPSFRTSDFFATLNNPRAKDRVLLILHTGAKRKGLTLKDKIADPAGLLKWLAPDRCLVEFRGGKDVAAKRTALQAIVRAWIREL